jgi:hypothetical protein
MKVGMIAIFIWTSLLPELSPHRHCAPRAALAYRMRQASGRAGRHAHPSGGGRGIARAGLRTQACSIRGQPTSPTTAGVAFAAKVNTAVSRLGIFDEIEGEFVALGMNSDDVSSVVTEMRRPRITPLRCYKPSEGAWVMCMVLNRRCGVQHMMRSNGHRLSAGCSQDDRCEADAI